ncbi:uncharacterized protein LOC144769186 [Lissotriton helveticus]
MPPHRTSEMPTQVPLQEEMVTVQLPGEKQQQGQALLLLVVQLDHRTGRREQLLCNSIGWSVSSRYTDGWWTWKREKSTHSCQAPVLTGPPSASILLAILAPLPANCCHPPPELQQAIAALHPAAAGHYRGPAHLDGAEHGPAPDQHP